MIDLFYGEFIFGVLGRRLKTNILAWLRLFKIVVLTIRFIIWQKVYFLHFSIIIYLLLFGCVLLSITELLQILAAIAILDNLALEVARITRHHERLLLPVLLHIGIEHGLTHVILVEASLASIVAIF